jgi:hypothetical protein
LTPKLTLASGATAHGSVLSAAISENTVVRWALG